MDQPLGLVFIFLELQTFLSSFSVLFASPLADVVPFPVQIQRAASPALNQPHAGRVLYGMLFICSTHVSELDFNFQWESFLSRYQSKQYVEIVFNF